MRCPECDSIDLSWGWHYSLLVPAASGMPTTMVHLGCNSCGHTLRIEYLEDLLLRVDPEVMEGAAA